MGLERLNQLMRRHDLLKDLRGYSLAVLQDREKHMLSTHVLMSQRSRQRFGSPEHFVQARGEKRVLCAHNAPQAEGQWWYRQFAVPLTDHKVSSQQSDAAPPRIARC
jgi:hypothetical protein